MADMRLTYALVDSMIPYKRLSVLIWPKPISLLTLQYIQYVTMFMIVLCYLDACVVSDRLAIRGLFHGM